MPIETQHRPSSRAVPVRLNVPHARGLNCPSGAAEHTPTAKKSATLQPQANLTCWTRDGAPHSIRQPMDGDVAAPADAVESQLKELIVDALKLEDVAPSEIDSDAELIGGGLGLDSIDVLELAMAVHKRFGVQTEADDVNNREIFSSVRRLAAFIVEQRAAGATAPA